MATTPSRVLLNDFRAQWMDVSRDVHDAVERVGQSGWLILGSEVEAFEKQLAPRFGCAHAIGCANGLDAIEIALRACGLQAGDKVLTTSMSAFATTLAIVRAGGVPVFEDIDAYGLLSLDRCEARLSSDSSIKFLLPVHLYGHAMDLKRLGAIIEKYHVTLIEDCAQAIGAEYQGQKVGSLGKAAITSFYPTKNLGCFGDGGAIVTNDAQIGAQAKQLRNYGQSTKYVHDSLGMNSRLDELQAAIMNSALLTRLDAFTQRRRAVAKRYSDEIRHPMIHIPGSPEGSNSVWHLFAVLVENGRESLSQHLASQGIDSAVHYPGLISDQKALSAVAIDRSAALEQTHRYANAELSLPIHPYLTEEDVSRVVAACNSWKTSS